MCPRSKDTYVYSSCASSSFFFSFSTPSPLPFPCSFISFLHLDRCFRRRSYTDPSDIRRRLIPCDTRGFRRAPAKVDFPFRDVDAANKSPSPTFKRRLSSYALSHPRSKMPYLSTLHFPSLTLSHSLSTVSARISFPRISFGPLSCFVSAGF